MLTRLDYLAPAGVRKAFRVFLLLTIILLFLTTLYSLPSLSQNSPYLGEELSHKILNSDQGVEIVSDTLTEDEPASIKDEVLPDNDADESKDDESQIKPDGILVNEPEGESDIKLEDILPDGGTTGADSLGNAAPITAEQPADTESNSDSKSEIQGDLQGSLENDATDARPLEPETGIDDHDFNLSESPEKPQDRRFVLVIPANSPNTDLCKTVATALALGYPTPVIINWGVDHRPITKWKGGANLPKIPGLVQYLDAAMHPEGHPSEKLEEDDLVLMVDAYDVWFQLPAEVLLRRYHDINAKANIRLRQQWPSKGLMPMRQTIVAGSGKNCHPKDPASGSDLRCETWPESPLRADLYGPETEKNETLYRDHRPRYINGGLYMGPAGDMRRLFRRAQQKMEAGINQGIHMYSEQGIPGEIFAEQELWRQWQRKTNLPSENATRVVNRDFEYHLGLDYGQDLSAQTFWTDMDADKDLFDGAFITLQNQTDVDAHSESLGISPVRLHGIPDDVQSQRNPLLDLDLDVRWGDLALYADFFLESVPAIVHHNGFKSRRKLWWHKPWYHPYLRQLLTLRMKVSEAGTPLAIVQTLNGTINYWAPLAEEESRSPRSMNRTSPVGTPLAKMRLHGVCHDPKEKVKYKGKNWWDEVFRDKKGPFEL